MTRRFIYDYAPEIAKAGLIAGYDKTQTICSKQVGAPTVPSAVIKCQFYYWSYHVIHVIHVI
jgi:hypothetical protein